jgi:predicted Ser/Thr protein kinase
MFGYIYDLYTNFKKIYQLKKQFSKIHNDFLIKDISLDNNWKDKLIYELQLFKTLIFACGSLYVKFLQWYISKLKSNLQQNNIPDIENTKLDNEQIFIKILINYFEDIFENCPYHDLNYTIEIFKSSMPGYTLEEYVDITTFKEIASGSIGQVYYAKRKKDNKEIAIKVKHPDIMKELKNQLEIIKIIKYLQSFKWFRSKYNMIFNIDDFLGDINMQCDFNIEANNCKKFRENFKESKNQIIFPEIIYQSEDMMISEYIAGECFDKLSAIQKHDITLNFMCFFYQMILVDNFIHGDLHCKNWKVRLTHDNKPQIIVYDCGICFSNISVELTHDFWFSIGKYDVEKLKNVINTFINIANPECIITNFQEQINQLFSIIMKNSVGTTMMMKSIISFFNNNNILAHKFILNFTILLCLVEDFLRKNDIIDRERYVKDSNEFTSNMFQIIKENQLDIITYCHVRNCYPKVYQLFNKEINDKYINENNPTKNKPILFNNINLSGLTFKPPE